LILLRLAFKKLKASERKPPIEQKATYASALTKGVYVLYGLLETKTPQGYFRHSADDRCRPQAWIKACLPKVSNTWGLSLDQRSSPLRQQHVSYRDIVWLFVVDLVGGAS
jgi:hypothetical protein